MKDLKLDEHTGLVLEGGGMRGVFTCGVLDYLMDHNIRFPYAIGVSAVGASWNKDTNLRRNGKIDFAYAKKKSIFAAAQLRRTPEPELETPTRRAKGSLPGFCRPAYRTEIG